MVSLVALGMVSQVLMRLDTWAHRRANAESELVKDLAVLQRSFDKANEKFSSELSRWQARMGDLHTDIRVLKEHIEGQDRIILGLERHLQKMTNGNGSLS